MNPELLRDWRRWAEAEREGRSEDADRAFRGVFHAVPAYLPGDGSTGRVAQTIARAAARQARLAKLAAAIGAVVAVALSIAVVLQLPRILRAALQFSVRVVIWTILAFERGLDTWTILAQAARAIGAVLLAPQVTIAMAGLGLLAVGALYALNRMLEPEERSSL